MSGNREKEGVTVSDELDPQEQELFLWQVSASLCSSVRVQQQMLASVTTTELMQVCIEAANDIIQAITEDE